MLQVSCNELLLIMVHYVPQRKNEPSHNALLNAAKMIVEHSEDIVNIIGTATRRIQYDGGAVHMAVEYGQHDILELILEHGAESSVTSKTNWAWKSSLTHS